MSTVVQPVIAGHLDSLVKQMVEKPHPSQHEHAPITQRTLVTEIVQAPDLTQQLCAYTAYALTKALPFIG